MGPFSRKLLASAAAVSVGAQAIAMSISEAGPPAGVPPADYKESQFVDQRGCIYVRTGSGQDIVWVPRVSRDGQVLCGFAPTFEAGENDKSE